MARITSIIVNIIIGFVFGAIIMYFIMPRVKYHGPNSTQMKQVIFRDEDRKCFHFVPQVYICPIALSMSLR